MKETDVEAIANLYAPVAKRYPKAFVLLATRREGQTFIINKRAITLEDLPSYLQTFNPKKHCDYYLTHNVYKGGFGKQGLLHWRREENLLSLCNVVIDIDFHDDDFSSRERKARLKDFDESTRDWLASKFHLEFSSVYTGRGVQFWLSFRPLASACRWMVDKLIDTLCFEFECILENDKYGEFDGMEVDEAASRRLSGVFRFPHTRNTKAGMGCFLHIAKDTDKDIRDIFDNLGLEELQPLPTSKKKEKVFAPTKEKSEGKKGKLRGTRDPRQSAFYTTFRDFLVWLAKTGQLKEGRRELCLFTYYNLIFGLTKSKVTAKKATCKLNTLLSVPLPARELERLLKSQENKAFYKFSYRTLFRITNTTEFEYQAFRAQYTQPYLIRKKKAQEEARKRTKIARAELAEQKAADIRRLLCAGLFQNEIRKEVHVNFRTIKACIEAGGTELKAKMEQGRKLRAELKPHIDVLATASKDEIKFLGLHISHIKHEKKQKAKIEAMIEREEREYIPLFDVPPRPSRPAPMPLPLSLTLALPYVLRTKISDFEPKQIASLAESLLEQRETLKREEEAKKAFIAFDFGDTDRDEEETDVCASHDDVSKAVIRDDICKVDTEEEDARKRIQSQLASLAQSLGAHNDNVEKVKPVEVSLSLNVKEVQVSPGSSALPEEQRKLEELRKSIQSAKPPRPLFNPNYDDGEKVESKVSLTEEDYKRLDDLLRQCHANPDLIPFAEVSFVRYGFSGRIAYAKWRYNMLEERKKRNTELYQQNKLEQQKHEQTTRSVPDSWKIFDEEMMPF